VGEAVTVPSRWPWRRLLIVTAVEVERTAVISGLQRADPAGSIVVRSAGVGVAAAAAATARALHMAETTGAAFDAVVSMGIGGGVATRVELGATVLGARSLAADLGASSPDGFISIDDLGFGSSTVDADVRLTGAIRSGLPDAVVGDILTVSTVTGTVAEAAALVARHPDAVAEAMEGYGVATAAALSGVPFAEIRTISNHIGPRDRSTWQIPRALAALRDVGHALASLMP
jgi:futalosine hydrolase